MELLAQLRGTPSAVRDESELSHWRPCQGKSGRGAWAKGLDLKLLLIVGCYAQRRGVYRRIDECFVE